MLEKYPEILKTPEVCEILRVSPITLRRWHRNGHLVGTVINSRGDRRYRKQDIEKLLLGTVQTNS